MCQRDSNFPVRELTGGGGGGVCVWRNQFQLLKPLLEGQHMGYLNGAKQDTKQKRCQRKEKNEQKL